MNNQALYKLYIDLGNAQLYGLFIADRQDVNTLIDEDIIIDFGDVAGKYSNIQTSVDRDDIEFVTDDLGVLNVVMGYGLELGYNPFAQDVSYSYIREMFPERDYMIVQQVVDILRSR